MDGLVWREYADKCKDGDVRMNWWKKDYMKRNCRWMNRWKAGRKLFGCYIRRSFSHEH
jgi:hypothetical protein